MDMAEPSESTRERIKNNLQENFDGKIVCKDLTKKIKEISPNSILIYGGQTTVINLIYNMGRKTVGLVAFCSIALARLVQSSMAVLEEMSIGETLMKALGAG